MVLNEVNGCVKENEISAAPQVLAGVALRGPVVSGDVLFTQRDLSEQIVAAGGHYMWKVKDNQPTLRADIERWFGPESVPRGSAPLKTDVRSVTTQRQVGGRLEQHTLTTRALLNATTDWPYVAQVCQLTREVQHLSSAQTTRAVSYLITSLPASEATPERWLTLSRRHWTIENQRHYYRRLK